MAKRIQRKRTKGWRMPRDAVYVGRPSKWGNPIKLRGQSAEGAVSSYREWLRLFSPDQLREFLRPLYGHDLACWCPLVDKDGRPVPCHADVLLDLANCASPDPEPNNG